MRGALKSFYFFLPVQLLLLHFRKSQLLLSFWLIVILTITGNFASRFGASSILLAPEYLGKINFMSMFLMGSAICVFMMTWHITTFIMHSKRLPYMGATRHAFTVYCINNSIIPLIFLIFYSVVSFRFQWINEGSGLGHIIWMQFGFYLGFLTLILVSFFYFFRVSRDFFKTVLSNITNPARIRSVIPYDTLDYEIDVIPARSFISGKLRVEFTEDIAPYHPRVMNTVMRRHHRNVIFAAFFSYFALLLMGAYMELPFFRVPAGAGFLLLFSIVMGFVGAFKYFMKSWEALGWITFAILLSVTVRYKWFDLRSIAYGLNYKKPVAERPVYDYQHLVELFTPAKIAADKQQEENRLAAWQSLPGNTDDSTLVVITTSGGGSRSAYWTFRVLQYMDSMSQGSLFKKTVLITGASGGMIGATYWRSVHDAYQQGLLKEKYSHKYQENIGKDLLNAIIFSLASVDLISPFNKISVGGYSYTRDRGFAMEEELISNTDSLLNRNLSYFKAREAKGQIPELLVNGTIVNDGRKLIMGNQPVGFLTQPEYSIGQAYPPIDAVDYSTFFAANDPGSLRITSALRMNATFPYVLPVVRLPSEPYINVMDAGLRDNFGAEISSRYVFALRGWIEKHIKNVVFIEIRDSQEYDVCASAAQSTLSNMLIDPLFVIQNKWEVFQSYKNSYIRDYAPYFMQSKLHHVMFSYVPRHLDKSAALNFHLTLKEKEDLYESIFNKDNQRAADTVLNLLKGSSR